MDGGLRILPSARFVEYSKAIRKEIDKYNETVQTFIERYPQIKATAKERLGNFLDGQTLPSPYEMKNKFGIRQDILPMPSASDFRVNINDAEANDIKVRCKLEDTTEKVLASVIDNYGNLASRSAELGEVVTKKPSISMTKEYLGYCYVESCSNCEILHKRIPKLVESYGG